MFTVYCSEVVYFPLGFIYLFMSHDYFFLFVLHFFYMIHLYIQIWFVYVHVFIFTFDSFTFDSLVTFTWFISYEAMFTHNIFISTCEFFTHTSYIFRLNIYTQFISFHLFFIYCFTCDSFTHTCQAVQHFAEFCLRSLRTEMLDFDAFRSKTTWILAKKSQLRGLSQWSLSVNETF